MFYLSVIRHFICPVCSMWSKSREQFCPLLWKLLPVKIEADQQLHWVCFAFFYLLAVTWEESHGVWFSTPTVKVFFTVHMITQYVPLGRTWAQLSLSLLRLSLRTALWLMCDNKIKTSFHIFASEFSYLSLSCLASISISQISATSIRHSITCKNTHTPISTHNTWLT